MTAIIAFIIIFGIIVIIHEFGHFYFAKRAGILVREFSVGMGPKLFATRKNGTTYTLRILPLGGYVRMAGLNDDETELKPGMQVSLVLNAENKVEKINTSERVNLTNAVPFQINHTDLQDALTIDGYNDINEETLVHYDVLHDATVIEADGTEVQIAPKDVQFQSASLINRILTNFAGPFNNFILAIVTFIVVAFLSGGVAKNEPVIGTIQAGSPAAQAKLLKNDEIISVNGKKVASFTQMSQLISQQPKQKVTLKVKRQKQLKTIVVTPKAIKVDGKTVGQLGVTAALDTSFMGKIKYGFSQSWSIASQIFKILGSFLTGGFTLNKLSGPVGMYSMTSQVAAAGLRALVYFMGFLSLNLGIMNLLPIPALDGGKLLLNLIEAIRRKPISPEKEGMITLVGVLIMVVLMVLVTWNDIQRFFF